MPSFPTALRPRGAAARLLAVALGAGALPLAGAAAAGAEPAHGDDVVVGRVRGPRPSSARTVRAAVPETTASGYELLPFEYCGDPSYDAGDPSCPNPVTKAADAHFPAFELLLAKNYNGTTSSGIETFRTALNGAAADAAATSGELFRVPAGQVTNVRDADLVDEVLGPDGGQIIVATEDFAAAGHDSPCPAPAVGCAAPLASFDDAGKLVIYGGKIWLDDSTQSWSNAAKEELIRHEIGHILGLDHYAGPAGDGMYLGERQNMFATTSSTSTAPDFRAGDKNGIRALAAPNGKFVRWSYRDFYSREVDFDGQVYWFSQISFGLSRFDYLGNLTRSNEWIGQVVDRLYMDTYGRAADPGGRAYWIDRLRNGYPVANAAADFYGLPEYFETKANSNVTTWVDLLYRKLLLREADAGGRAYWVNETNRRGRISVAYDFYQSFESRQTRVTNLYAKLLQRGTDPGGRDYWAGRVLTEGDLVLAQNLAASDEYFTKAQTRTS